MPGEKPVTRPRVSLTSKQLASEEGATLLNLLTKIMADGRLADEEILELSSWIHRIASASSVPGVHFLREEIGGVLADGTVSAGELRLLQDAVLRVLPVSEREKAKSAIVAARVRDWRPIQTDDDRATERQIEYIRDLGGSCPAGATKSEASALIDQLLTKRPTARQRMVLRFWNRLDLMTAGVEGVSAWLDGWYAEDPDRQLAWSLWKTESGDEGGRSPADVDDVPLGDGEKYLARVKAGSPQSPANQDYRPEGTRRGGCLGQVIIILVGLATIALVCVWSL